MPFNFKSQVPIKLYIITIPTVPEQILKNFRQSKNNQFKKTGMPAVTELSSGRRSQTQRRAPAGPSFATNLDGVQEDDTDVFGRAKLLQNLKKRENCEKSE